jgi:hypothetical protein
VDVEGLSPVIAFTKRLVPAHKHNLRNPCQQRSRDREGSRRTERNDVSRPISLRPKVWCPINTVSHRLRFRLTQVRYDLPDERGIHNRSDDANSNSFLLRRLTTCRSAPTQDQRVDTIRANGEDDHGDIASRRPNFGTSQCKAEGSDSLGDSNMPRPLIKLSRRPGHCDGDNAGDEVRGACQD